MQRPYANYLSKQRVFIGFQTPSTELVYEDGLWHVGEHCAEILVLANGDQVKQFSQTAIYL